MSLGPKEMITDENNDLLKGLKKIKNGYAEGKYLLII